MVPANLLRISMRLRTLLIVVLVLSVGVVSALALRSRFDTRGLVQATPVPQGDQEIAWLHTSTSNAAWERFVAGAKHARRSLIGLEVDDSRAFPERSTEVPEVVLSMANTEGKIRVRWYKLSDAANTQDWVHALAEREPPPLAIIGGDTSDRARDLAQALQRQEEWHGTPPLFFITTATVDNLHPIDDPDKTREPLLQLYPGRTFRFCFSNQQMAQSVFDFIWRNPDLRPRGALDFNPMLPNIAPTFGISGWNELFPKATLLAQPGKCFVLSWQDDPYSSDFNEAFYALVNDGTRLHTYQLKYNVGTFDQANHHERERAEQLVEKLPTHRGTHSLLVLPAGARTSRRFIRTVTGDAPFVGRKLAVVTGDSISFNTVYRDSEIMWNVRDLPVPLVFFAHQNPVAWDVELPPPSGTDDVLQFDEMVRVLMEASYGKGENLLGNADQLAKRLRQRTQVPLFDTLGNRQSGGEHIVYFRPDIRPNGRIEPTACVTVWRHTKEDQWETVRRSGLVVPAPQEGYLDCDDVHKSGGLHASE